jgi:hypothetical protein
MKRIASLSLALVICATVASIFFYKRAHAATQYTWNVGSGAFSTASNWNPARTSPAADDILVFNTAGAITLTNVTTQTIGQLSVGGGAQVTFQAGTPGAQTLTISGGANALDIAAGAQLNVSGVTNVLNINLTSGTSGRVAGSMTFTDAAHRLTGFSASPIAFKSGSTFTAGAGFSGNAFGTANLNSINFENGSTYVGLAGSNPFGAGQPNSVVVFQSGSLYSFQQNAAPSFSGRTYANFEINAATYSQTSAGGNPFTVDNLTVTAGVAHLQLTNVTIKGNVSVASGATLDFNPAAVAAIGFSGTSAQTVTNSGTLTFNNLSNITVGNTAGVSLNSALTWPGTNVVNAGATLATGAALTNSGTMTVNGTFQLNQGGSALGNNFVYNAATGTLKFNNSSGSFAVTGTPVFWPAASGPQNVNVAGSGGITMNVARTVGTLFQYAAGVSGAGNLTLTGTTQVNTGGFVSGSPTYGGVSSLLKYNTGGTYNRNGEWLPGATSGAGYPTHVQLSNNTTLDLVNASNSPYQMAGDLTIDIGSTMQLSLSGLTNPLTIFGSVNNDGTFTLANTAGGDVNVGGNWNNNGAFNNNGRTVNLNGSIGQAISGNSNFFNLTKNTAVAQTLTFAAGSTQTVTNLLTLNGAAGNLLSLRSSVSGTQWKINAPSTQSVNFVDVKDSDASGGTVITPGSSVDSLNNINWIFAAADYTVTTTGNAIVVTDVSGNSDTLAVSEPGASQITFAAAGRNFSVDGGPFINGNSGNLSLTGVNSITVNQENGNDTLNMSAFATMLPSLTINGGNGDDVVNLNGSLSFLPASNLDLDLQNDTGAPGIDSVNIAASAQVVLSTTGTATIKASRNFTMAASSLLQVADGVLTIEGNQQGVATVGDFNGVDLIGGKIQTVGAGNVFIKGTGGAGDFIENVGVKLSAGGTVHANATGALDVQGTGGNGTGSATAGQSNLGFYATGSGSKVDSTSAAITITGTGGTTNDNNVIGITLDELAVVETDGAGTLTITGNGGTVNGGSTTFVNSGGIFITPGDVNGDGGSVKSTGTGANAGAIILNGTATNGGNGAAQGVRVDAPGLVSSVDGSITITGTGAACGNACLGTSIRGPVSATGTGAISLTGTGAASTGAFPTHGVNVRSGGNVTTVNGNITIDGTGGNGADNAGFNLASAGSGILQTTGTGNITAIADIMKIGPGAGATINAGTRTVTLRDKTGVAINLGSAADPTGGPLGLSDAELDRITLAGTINIGNTNSGGITVSAPITRPTASNLVLTSGANIDLPSSLNSNGGDVSLLPTTNNFASGSGVDVTTSATTTLTLAAFKNLTTVINSTTVDTGYTQLNVAGRINLNNAQLALSGSHTPAVNDQFIIVNNDGTDPIVGTFNSLPQGAVIPNFLGSALSARISYVGGDGNDAVIVVNSPTASPSSISGQIVDTGGLPVEGAAVRLNGTQNRLTMSDKLGNYHFDNVETGGFYSVTPTRVNYSFNPVQRNFSQLASNTEAIFTGTAAGTFFNPLDTTEYFVRQQYLDFLGREPDEAGLTFWVNNIESCGQDFNCRAAKREDTSAAFFLSIEFHETGYLAYRVHQTAFGDLPGAPVPVDFNTFGADSAKLSEGLVVNATGWQDKLEANKQAFLAEFVARARFATAYPITLTPSDFVARLAETAGVTLTTSERQVAIAEFGDAQDSANVSARARALRRIAESASLDAKERNSAFVLLQYFGYLGRDPNAPPDGNFNGYQFWLDKLESFHGDFRRAEMVKSFLVAGEYRGRFPR